MKNFGLLGVAALLGALGFYFGSAGGDYAGYDVFAFLAAGIAFCAQLILVNTRRGVLATALYATFANAYLLKLKFAPGEAICDVNAVISCSSLNDSAASELFGLPVTLYGVGFYVGLALASFGDPKRTPRFDQVNGLFAIGSLVFSAYLGWEAKKLGLVCPFCITIYACNALLLWSAFKGLGENDRKLFDGVDRIFGTSSLWVVTATFALITLVGASSWNDFKANDTASIVENKGKTGAKLDENVLARLYAKPKGTIETDGTEPVLGNVNASVTIVEFADYNCGHCSQASPVLKQIVENNPDVKLVFKAFPLSGACNPLLEGTEGVERCKAAMAAECAGQQGRYFELSGKLFKNMQFRTDADLQFMASETVPDMDAWGACMQSDAPLQSIQADALAGGKAQVMGTPAMFVKGLVGDDWVEITQGPMAIQALLEAKMDGLHLPAPN